MVRKGSRARGMGSARGELSLRWHCDVLLIALLLPVEKVGRFAPGGVPGVTGENLAGIGEGAMTEPKP